MEIFVTCMGEKQSTSQEIHEWTCIWQALQGLLCKTLRVLL
jgi:hypothetical protein